MVHHCHVQPRDYQMEIHPIYYLTSCATFNILNQAIMGAAVGCQCEMYYPPNCQNDVEVQLTLNTRLDGLST
jgi:hypothetical protein